MGKSTKTSTHLRRVYRNNLSATAVCGQIQYACVCAQRENILPNGARAPPVLIQLPIKRPPAALCAMHAEHNECCFGVRVSVCVGALATIRTRSAHTNLRAHAMPQPTRAGASVERRAMILIASRAATEKAHTHIFRSFPHHISAPNDAPGHAYRTRPNYPNNGTVYPPILCACACAHNFAPPLITIIVCVECARVRPCVRACSRTKMHARF